MTQVFNQILLNDTVGLVDFKTLDSKNIYLFYNKQKTTMEAILNSFLNNYSCNEVNNDNINFYNETNKNYISTNDYNKTPYELKYEKMTKITIVDNSHPTVVVAPKKEVYDTSKYENFNDQDIIKNDLEFNINIKTLTGDNFGVQIKPSEYVFDVLTKIYKLTGMPESEQRLIFVGKQLETTTRVADVMLSNKLSNNSDVHLVLKLRGGMYHETSGKNGNFQPLKSCAIFVDVENVYGI